MTAKRKAANKKKATTRKAQAAPAAAPKPYSAQDPGERKFLNDTYTQTRALLPRVEDKSQRAAYDKRLKDIKAKFTALPKTKVTKDRVFRYVEEVTKIGREIATRSP